MSACINQTSASALKEIDIIVSKLERGTIISKLYSKLRRSNQRRLRLVRETRQLLWSTLSEQNKNEYEGSIELREIREIRPGKNSKDFRICANDNNCSDITKCFVILYGSVFKLKTFSAVALSEVEANNWVKGLHYMVKDTLNAPYSLQLQRWLRRYFSALEYTNTHSLKTNCANQVCFKDFKNFLLSVNCKMSTTQIMKYFEDDAKLKHDLSFDDFFRIYQTILLPANILDEICNFKAEGFPYCNNDNVIKLTEFIKFLKVEQYESVDNVQIVSNIISNIVQDIERDTMEPYLSINEFVNYLFSKENDLWDDNCDRVYMDMKQSLSSYWIASSHNTYLTGDQFSSESSCEAYTRALRMGCRCIELDCWNGPDSLPYIFHGHTMTSKIKFKDVIKTIKAQAFVTSEYPVILSIEQNCSLEQQRNMAKALKEVFGDLLLKTAYNPSETQLPSPYNLRKKIILKHKKLPEFDDCSLSTQKKVSIEKNSLNQHSSMSSGNDETEKTQKFLKRDKLYLRNHLKKTWSLYSFILTNKKLMFSSAINSNISESFYDDECIESKAVYTKQKDVLINDELHFGENWFHGKLEGGRQKADKLLEDHKHLGDGTFLVRDSGTFVGDYSLSFWCNNRPNHCRIKLKHDCKSTKYYLVENCVFDSVYSLISYYRKNMLHTSEFTIALKDPIPQPKTHECQEWFHQTTTKNQAEQGLINLEIGSFLIRPSEQISKTYVISFKVCRNVQHCRIALERRLYIIGSMQFESLIHIVNFYMRNPLYSNIKLTQPVSKTFLLQCVMENHDDSLPSGETSNYVDSILENRVTCKALHSYKAEKPDELSFPKHAIITNVQTNSTMWWRGDYGGVTQRYLPANYVKILSPIVDNINLLEKQASTVNYSSVDILGAVVSLFQATEPGILIQMQVQTQSKQNPLIIGFDNQEIAYEWFQAIQTAVLEANQLTSEHRKKERNARVAKEMSDLIVYFRSVTFRDHSWVFHEMSSFSESKAEKQLLDQNSAVFISYNQNQISRVYPKGQRLDSSNFNPVPFWNSGAQMIALNYQTGDKAMQINQAKFRDNGNSGYILKPKFMQVNNFDPNNEVVDELEEVIVTIRIITARNLFCGGKSNNPQIAIEIVGASFDSGVKYRTKVHENCFNPIWNETCEFTVRNPHFAFLRFEVLGEDMFSETHFIAQASYPLTCIRQGYRCIILRNKFSEELELSSLLVHVNLRRVKPEKQLIY